MQLSEAAREAGIGELRFELIDDAPKYGIYARELKNLRALRTNEIKKALATLGTHTTGFFTTNESGFYINGEQIIGFGAIVFDGEHHKQTLALNYLEGA